MSVNLGRWYNPWLLIVHTLKAGIAAVLSLRSKGEATVGAFVDVAMAQEQRSHNDRLIVLVDQFIDHHLLDDPVRHRREILLLEVHQDDAGFEAAAQIEQRVERQGGNVRTTPTVRTLLYVLLVLDPTGRFLPFPFLTTAGQLVQLYEHLVRAMIVQLLVLGRG
uniref:Putative secreted protein n=1 Tax=Anopheles marajoara TaxID=58244 RepID=A0A2M4C642_9DIPT